METKTTAKHGDRTIKVSIHFWTDKIPSRVRGEIQPRHAWKHGVVNVRANKAHGIKAVSRAFNRFEEMPSLVKDLLEAQGVVFHDIQLEKEAS